VVPVGRFGDYGFSHDYKSFDPKLPANAERVNHGDGDVPHIISKTADSITIYAYSAETKLTIPLGWYGMDRGNETVIYSPDEKSRFILRFIPGSSSANFVDFKKNALSIMQKQMNQPDAKFTQFELPDGSFGVEVRDVTTKEGHKNSIVIIYTPNPNPTKGQTYACSISLTSPAPVFTKYEGLLGLMLQDRKIKWPDIEQTSELTPDQIERSKNTVYVDSRTAVSVGAPGGVIRSEFNDDIRRIEKEKPYRAKMELVVSSLVKGDLQELLNSADPEGFTKVDKSNVSVMIRQKLIPFFSDFKEDGHDDTDAPTDAGFNFYRSFTSKKGNKKHYMVSIVERGGKLCWAGVILDVTYQSTHPDALPE
jgi:hypothetical protein